MAVTVFLAKMAYVMVGRPIKVHSRENVPLVVMGLMVADVLIAFVGAIIAVAVTSLSSTTLAFRHLVTAIYLFFGLFAMLGAVLNFARLETLRVLSKQELMMMISLGRPTFPQSRRLARLLVPSDIDLIVQVAVALPVVLIFHS